MSKRKGPALYELISSARESEQKQSPDTPERQEQDVDLQRNVLTPGRAIRMSIGTIGVVAAVCITLIIISYTAGYQNGIAKGDAARDDYAARLQEVFVEPIKPPITTQNPTLPIIPQPRAELGNTAWGPVLSDPRRPDFYHYVLINTTKEGAMQLASFCRVKGLETYVVSGHNTRRFNVVAFPGSANRNSPEMKLVQSKIHAIGQEWAGTKEGRGSDLKDAYPIR